MQVEEELAQFSSQQDSVLTIGVFDGVHLGHRYLIEYLKRQALVRDYSPGVVTFRQHPVEVLAPQTSLPRLTSIEERIRLIRELGIQLVVPLSFTRELAELSAREFVTLLQNHLRMRGLVVGPDFALGCGREGNVFNLNVLGKEMGFWVDVVPPKVIDGEVASSTGIRQALVQGQVSRVKQLLGHPYSLTGQVVHGQKRGRQIGYPTANIALDSDQALPADGVYATRASLGDQAFPSVTNIGTCPTFGPGGRTVEVFLLGQTSHLYGRALRVELVERLRDEKCFSNAEELKTQIGRDVEQALSVLSKEQA